MLEHEQWMQWAKTIVTSEAISAERKARWFECFKPYHELTAEQKEHDRVWARKVLAYVDRLPVRESSKANHYDMAIATDFPDGISLYVQENGVGGHTYYTDEVGCGVMVWDTALVSERTLLAAIEHNKGNQIEGGE